jgi:DNA polymerase-1
MARLLIVDGHAYAYRAFYAIRSLKSPSGQAVNAIFGFVKMLAKLRAGLQPSHVLVVWDGGLSAERLTALPGYKAQRPEMPADLGTQLDEIVSYLAAANLASYCREGVEADDYIARVARVAANVGLEVVIASSDKDFMQLVSPAAQGGTGQIGLLNPNDKSERIWTATQVRDKTGVAPEQIVDWLSLVGDSVDNIPGVPGVGPKTATDLLRQFGSVAELYRRLGEVKSERIRAALRTAETDVRRNQALVRLKEDVGGEISVGALAVQPAANDRLAELFRGWGFRSLLAELVAAPKPGAGGEGSLARQESRAAELI